MLCARVYVGVCATEPNQTNVSQIEREQEKTTLCRRLNESLLSNAAAFPYREIETCLRKPLRQEKTKKLIQN